MDPAGILMLRSIRILFEKLRKRPESIKFIKEEFNSQTIVNALNDDPKKCPTIVTCDIFGDQSPHVMVASNTLKGRHFMRSDRQSHLREEWFILCKNSARDDVQEPGTVEILILNTNIIIIGSLLKIEYFTYTT